MTWIVEWQGREYDVDPAEFSGAELKLIKERTGLTYMKLLNAVAKEQDGEAICALFWIVDRRSNQDLKFSDYDGPPLKVVLTHFDGLLAAIDEAGKAMGASEKSKDSTETPTTQTDGGLSSPSSIPEPSTEPSTTG